MTHAPGCLGTAGACRLSVAEADNVVEYARLVASTACADDSRGSQQCQCTWRWNNGEVERVASEASQGAWCNTDLPGKATGERWGIQSAAPSHSLARSGGDQLKAICRGQG